MGIGLMTIFNMIALYPLSGEALDALRAYEKEKAGIIKSLRQGAAKPGPCFFVPAKEGKLSQKMSLLFGRCAILILSVETH